MTASEVGREGARDVATITPNAHTDAAPASGQPRRHRDWIDPAVSLISTGRRTIAIRGAGAGNRLGCLREKSLEGLVNGPVKDRFGRAARLVSGREAGHGATWVAGGVPPPLEKRFAPLSRRCAVTDDEDVTG